MANLGSGVHKIPIEDYILDPVQEPSLNAGIAHTLLTMSPLHAFMQHPKLNPAHTSDESSRLDIGSIAHALLLEDDSSRVVVIEEDDWRTKAAKEQRDTARATGKLPILSKEYFGIQEMVARAKYAIAKSEFASDFREATPEQTLVWQHDGIWCRSRPDKATSDWRVLFDYKTVSGSAHPSSFIRSIVKYGYDLQAELGMMGVEDLRLSQHKPTFVFIVQEINLPYGVSFVTLSPEWQELAHQKLSRAMSIWKGCLRKNMWLGYTSKLAYITPPAYTSIGWDDYLPLIDAEDII